MKLARLIAAVAAGLLLISGLWVAAHRPERAAVAGPTAVYHQTPVFAPSVVVATEPTPLQLILAPPPGAGDTPLDQEISRLQKGIKKTGIPATARLATVEKLGWAFVGQARAQDDEGCYKLAEQCALVIAAEQPNSPGAKLLRGHVLHQFHRFKEAEALARQLVAVRTQPLDYGLLGDCLMEQGHLDGATKAYQTMLDLKPGFESYVRAAHLRWLQGDLNGARDLMRQVLGMMDSRETAILAWTEGRVALYAFQAGDLPAATEHAGKALRAKPNDAAAHLVLARVLSFEGREAEALDHFRTAAKTRPLPEFLWALADHLEAGRFTAEAAPIERTLRQTGSRADPRTMALYLATTRQDAAGALRLAQTELENRQDVFTWDALAWSQFANGQVLPARDSMRRALAEGTQDGRLFLHAAVIAAAAGDENEKREFARKADSLKQMLLPSERRLLDGLAASNARPSAR